MSLIFTETFAATQAGQQSTPGKFVMNGSVYISTGSGGRSTGNGYGFGNGGSGQIARQVAAAEEHVTFIAGGAFLMSSAPASESSLIELRSDNNAVSHITVTTGTDRTIAVWRGVNGGALMGRTALPLLTTNSVWYYVEVKATLGDGTAGSVTVMVDGVVVLNLTGVDTRNAGTKAVFDGVRWWCPASNWWLSDLYLCNGAGAVNNDLLQAPNIYGLRPNGNGNSSQGVGSDGNSTDNYLLVDDAGLGGSDWVDLVNTGDQDTYAVTDVGRPNTTPVLGAMVWAFAQKTDAAAREVSMLARSGGTEVAVPATAALVNGVLNYTGAAVEAKPGGGAWTVADLNAMEFGARAT